AIAEERSEHPIAQLIRKKVERLQPVGFEAVPGAGVLAQFDQQSFAVGNRRLMEKQQIEVPTDALAALDRLDAAGQTCLFVARDGGVIGVIGGGDRLGADAAPIIAELRAAGIKPIVLLTGDRTAVARAVASELNIDDFHAELLPMDKAAVIDRYAPVAMVG